MSETLSPLSLSLVLGLVGLMAIDGWVTRLTRRSLPRHSKSALAAGVGLAAIAISLAPQLGLRYGETLVPRVLAGFIFALLLSYLLCLLPRLRPLLGKTLTARPHAIFFALPLVVYAAILPWVTTQRAPDGDEPYYLLITHSLAYDFDADLTNNYFNEDSLAFVARPLEPQVHDPVGANGELFSRHNIALPLVLAPAYRIAGKFGALLLMAVFAALFCWWTLRLARHYFPAQPGAVLIAYMILAFSPPLLFYALQVWVEIPGALLLCIALDQALALPKENLRRVRPWLWFVAPLLFMPLLKMRFLLLVLPTIALAAWQLGGRGRKFVLRILGGAILLAGGILVFNQIQYGNPLKYHDVSKLGFYFTDPGRYWKGLLGIFFDSGFGLFATAPIWLLLLAPTKGRRKLLLHTALICGPYLVALIPRSEWYGGWSPPFRYGSIALSLLCLLLVPALQQRRRLSARLIVAGCGFASAVLSCLWVARPGWTFNLAHGRTHLLDILSQSQGRDVARLFPSAIRVNAALFVWVVLLCVAIWLLWRLTPPARSAAIWAGSFAPLGLLATTLWLSHQATTRTVEFEDPHLEPRGGLIWPEEWVTGRTRFRGAWRLAVGDSINMPVISGGSKLNLEIEARRFGSTAIDAQLIVVTTTGAARTIDLSGAAKWSHLKIEGMEWTPEDDDLSVALVAAAPTDPGSETPATVLLDRVELDWSE